MKNTLFNRLSLLMMVVLFVSCKKEVDQPFIEEELGLASKKSPAPCKIMAITSSVGFGPWVLHWIFEYNSFGDPVSVITDQEGTGNPNLYFRYNDNHQLTDIIGLYGVEPTATGYEFWQVLHYNSEGQIVSSTNYFWGDYGNEPDPNSYDVYTTEFTYDDRGRIVGRFLQYDSKGNLILDGKYKYDSKNNIRRTHPIWMFIDANYSLNNPAGDLKYNHSKYPVQFNSPSNFLGKFFDRATVVYDCH